MMVTSNDSFNTFKGDKEEQDIRHEKENYYQWLENP